MKKYILWVAAAVAFILLIAGAYLLYDKLSEDYEPENMTEDTDSVAAPDFTMLDYDGNEVKLSDFKGKPVVLNFWASWCPPCKAELPDFDETCKKRDDVQFIILNVTDGQSETVASAKEYIEGEGYSFPVYFDTKLEASNAYGASSIPMTFFIDKDMNVVTYATGMISADTLEKGIDLID